MNLKLEVKKLNNEDVIATSEETSENTICTTHPLYEHVYICDDVEPASVYVDRYIPGNMTGTHTQIGTTLFDNAPERSKWYYLDVNGYTLCDGNHDNCEPVIH